MVPGDRKPARGPETSKSRPPTPCKFLIVRWHTLCNSLNAYNRGVCNVNFETERMDDWTLFLIVINLTFLAPLVLALWIARRQRRRPSLWAPEPLGNDAARH